MIGADRREAAGDVIENTQSRMMARDSTIPQVPPASIAILLILSLAYVGGRRYFTAEKKTQVPIPLSKKYDYSRIRVTMVIDGDTVELADGEKVRYIGINTPELWRKVNGRWVRDPRPFAEESAEFNRSLTEGKLVKLEFDVERRDKYERLLAYVYLDDDTFVNAELVRQGYAQIMTIPPNVKYVDLFLRLQREARAQNRGLWGR